MCSVLGVLSSRTGAFAIVEEVEVVVVVTGVGIVVEDVVDEVVVEVVKVVVVVGAGVGVAGVGIGTDVGAGVVVVVVKTPPGCPPFDFVVEFVMVVEKEGGGGRSLEGFASFDVLVFVV